MQTAGHDNQTYFIFVGNLCSDEHLIDEGRVWERDRQLLRDATPFRLQKKSV
jgi:hypothetical protein